VKFIDISKIAKNAFGKYVDQIGEYLSFLIQIKVSYDRVISNVVNHFLVSL
jgi:hypothetical protein